MRARQSFHRGLALSALAASLSLLTACPKHENFPTALALVEAPAPGDFSIASLGRDPTDGLYDYDLTWSISDPTNVDRYRLYLVGAGLSPELLEEPTGTSFQFSLAFDAKGLQFGLSTVSTGSVESAMTVATVPAAP